MSESATMRRLKEWIIQVNPEATDIGPDVDIIDERIISSLQFVSFILYIEELRGEPIDADELDLESLRTLTSIEANHLAGVADGAGS